MSSFTKMPLCRDDLPDTLPYSEDVSVLATPFLIKRRTAANRFLYQPMEGCDGTIDGTPGELTVRRYMRFAAGGAGIIWFEASAVTAEGRANPRQMFMSAENSGEFARLVDNIKETCLKVNGFEPLVICQLTHSGRYSKPYGAPRPLIAYNNPLFEKDTPIDKSSILSDSELDRVCELLVNGTRICETAGFDGADIKSCHRYLLSELLSAYTRPGRYGGSFENRTRLLTTAASRAAELCSPDFIITSRLNIYDGFEYPYGFGVTEAGGLVPDYSEPVRLCQSLNRIGMPLLNITMGNPYVNSEVNRPAAASVEPLGGVARMLNGAATIAAAVPDAAIACSALSFLGTQSANVAAGGIVRGDFALAGYGRETLAYPDLARDVIQNGAPDPSKLCVACGKCTSLMRAGREPGCVVRDSKAYSLKG